MRFTTCEKPDCLKPNSGIAPKVARAVCFTKYEADNALKNLHLPPRGYYTFSVAGGTCHHDRRKRTSHSKRYYSRIEKEIVYKERCHPLRNGIHQSYSVGFVFVHLKKDLVELFLLLLGFGREELIAGKRDIFLSAVLLTV